jgi:hypothetical protein
MAVGKFTSCRNAESLDAAAMDDGPFAGGIARYANIELIE